MLHESFSSYKDHRVNSLTGFKEFGFRAYRGSNQKERTQVLPTSSLENETDTVHFINPSAISYIIDRTPTLFIIPKNPLLKTAFEGDQLQGSGFSDYVREAVTHYEQLCLDTNSPTTDGSSWPKDSAWKLRILPRQHFFKNNLTFGLPPIKATSITDTLTTVLSDIREVFTENEQKIHVENLNPEAIINIPGFKEGETSIQLNENWQLQLTCIDRSQIYNPNVQGDFDILLLGLKAVPSSALRELKQKMLESSELLSFWSKITQERITEQIKRIAGIDYQAVSFPCGYPYCGALDKLRGSFDQETTGLEFEIVDPLESPDQAKEFFEKFPQPFYEPTQNTLILKPINDDLPYAVAITENGNSSSVTIHLSNEYLNKQKQDFKENHWQELYDSIQCRLKNIHSFPRILNHFDLKSFVVDFVNHKFVSNNHNEPWKTQAINDLYELSTHICENIFTYKLKDERVQLFFQNLPRIQINILGVSSNGWTVWHDRERSDLLFIYNVPAKTAIDLTNPIPLQ